MAQTDNGEHNIEELREELRAQHLEQHRQLGRDLAARKPPVAFLPRSRKSALIMCIVAFLSNFTSYGLLTIVFHIGQGSDIAATNDPERILPWYLTAAVPIMALLVLALFIGIGAFVIHQFFRDKSHYGKEGLIRWAVFGAMLALLTRVSHLPESLDIAEPCLGVILLIASYLLAFKMIP